MEGQYYYQDNKTLDVTHKQLTDISRKARFWAIEWAIIGMTILSMIIALACVGYANAGGALLDLIRKHELLIGLSLMGAYIYGCVILFIRHILKKFGYYDTQILLSLRMDKMYNLASMVLIFITAVQIVMSCFSPEIFGGNLHILILWVVSLSCIAIVLTMTYSVIAYEIKRRQVADYLIKKSYSQAISGNDFSITMYEKVKDRE